MKQASSALGRTRVTSDSLARELSIKLVILINGILKRRLYAMISLNSGVSPELDNANIASFALIIPISPWLASPG